MTSEVSYAWAAGFIDGEGCFYPVKNYSHKDTPYTKVYLTINQANPEVLHKLQSILGGNVGSPRLRNDALSQKPIHRYTLAQKDLSNHIKGLWPHLGNIKRKQYNRALRAIKTGNLE